MKAALFKAYGKPLEITDIPDPKPGAGELVVRMVAAPVAAYAREVFNGTRPYPLLLPLVPGVGGIGVVEEVGPDATRLRPGQLVFCDSTVRSRDDSVSPDVMLQGWIAPGAGAHRRVALSAWGFCRTDVAASGKRNCPGRTGRV